MIGIKAIAGYLPEQRISNVDRAEEVGKDVDFIIDKVGFTSLLRKSDDEDTSDLCVKAFEALLTKMPEIDRDKIDCLIIAILCQRNSVQNMCYPSTHRTTWFFGRRQFLARR